MGAALPQEPHEDCDADPLVPGFTGFNKWSYTLKFDLPSRMASAKNAMGNSVAIIPEYVAPDIITNSPLLTAAWTVAGGVFPPSSPPTASDVTFPRVVITTATNSVGTVDTWVYTLEAGPDNYLEDPGIPFQACGVSDAGCSVGQPVLGTFTVSAPKDVVGQTRFSVNWGLITYGTTLPVPYTAAEAIKCQYANVQQLVDIRDNIQPVDNHDVTAIEGYLQLSASGGLTPSGWTPTKSALDLALQSHQDIFDVDPLYKCNRGYGTVLITDGLSNTCNPNDGAWFADCTHRYPDALCFAECVDALGDPAPASLPCTGYTVNPVFGACCDGAGAVPPASGFNCSDADPSAIPNNNYTQFGAGSADLAWDLQLQRGVPLLPDPALRVRTFVIGISDIVGPCELNRIAYRGRTDAALADFGITNAGSYLPPNTFEYGTANHGNYAIFANDPDSLAAALKKIADAGAAGDYVTTAPVSGGTIDGQQNTQYLSSVDYPEWKGHFYALDVSRLPSDPLYEKWDAGQVLRSTDPATRKIYTWNPSSGALIKIDYSAATRNALDVLTSSPAGTFTPGVIDFILGNDGSGTSALAQGARREWMLGGIINSTPAVVTPPTRYSNLSVQNHAGFEAAYSQRKPVVWVGSDDGMLHCFNAEDGSEITALLPPNLLARQITFYQNYLINAADSPTGQLSGFTNHVYGVASSLRYLDVYFPNALPEPTYKTVGIITEGPAGRLIAAIDITHPSPTDPSYGTFDGAVTSPAEPVKVLWTLDGATATDGIANVFETWSIPGVAPVTADKWRMVFGGGENPASTVSTPVAPKAFVLDVTDGTFQTPSAPHNTTNDATNPPWVGNQAVAHAGFLDTDAPSFLPDNKADLGLVPDLNGRIWFVSSSAPAAFDTFVVGIDASKFVGQSQPLYYTTAVSGYGPRGSGCDLFTFGSGSFYEESDAVSGSQIGDDSDQYFQPSLYLAVKPKGVSPMDSSPSDPGMFRVRLRDIPRPAGDPAGAGNLGQHTQVIASPFIVVPRSGIGTSDALFLVFDPDNGCLGRTYVVKLTFTSVDCEVQAEPVESTDGGEGAGGGFSITPQGDVIISKSGDHAYTQLVTDVQLEPPPAHLTPTWWRELK